MTPQFDAMIYAASIWVIPLIIQLPFMRQHTAMLLAFSATIRLGSSVV
jgi:hypothetical protein